MVLLLPGQELSKMIPQSVVGVLESDSSNVVQLIKNAYNVRKPKLSIYKQYHCHRRPDDPFRASYLQSNQGVNNKFRAAVENVFIRL